MPLELTKKLWTVEEVLRMQETGLLSPDNRLELIRGELIEMSPTGSRHFAAVMRVHLLLVEAIGRNAQVFCQSPISLDFHSAPEPDLGVLRFREDFYAGHLPCPGDIFLLIEVADSSLEIDRKIKGPLYSEFGIPEFWIINLQDRRLERYQFPGKDGYEKCTVMTEKDKIGIPGLGVSISVGEMLGTRKTV